ncbi:MAG: nucleoid-associated protein [Chloroherpetonaceae bacterium]|nr:nucleoid-associated protein [Chloroherpetonaceae bacterium]
MIDYSKCTLKSVSVHHIGSKTNGEELQLSANSLEVTDERLKELLMQYFLSSFSDLEVYAFTFTNGDFKLNPIYTFTSQMFEGKPFHRSSINVAKHLYELSTHPQIKPGDLFVAHFTNIVMENEVTDAIGIFKSENRQPFLKLNSKSNDFQLHYDDGIAIDKLDKGCLIFESDADLGYKVCIVDKSNKAFEAQYWRDTFLQLKPRSDEYHQTKEIFALTKNFVTKKLAAELELPKSEQIEILNRTVDYFKNRDTFTKRTFEKDVFQEPEIIKSFRKYDEEYRERRELEAVDTFDISEDAVKREAKIFKRVIKLDKNFQIHILGGSKELIVQGKEKDGRKFYKIYYEEET